jgi:hypothetical protein
MAAASRQRNDKFLHAKGQLRTLRRLRGRLDRYAALTLILTLTLPLRHQVVARTALPPDLLPCEKQHHPVLVAKGGWLLEREERRTPPMRTGHVLARIQQ